jgi:hypothetical protein
MLQRFFGIDLGEWVEITFFVVLIYLIIANAQGFSSAIRSTSNAYIGAVKALQGR